MTENEAASTRDGETFSISEAAAALGVSERTVRRRCERGELAAQMETGESGGRVWRVDRAAIAERAAKSSDRADSVRPDGRADVRPSVRPHSESENGVRPKRAAKIVDRAAKRADSVRPHLTARSNDRADSDARVLAAETEARVLREALQREREATARERETSDQWRAQVEAANRDAAEMRAALREALRAMPKQITGEYSQSETGAQNDLEPSKSDAAGKAAGAQKTGGQRAPRSLWRVMLGLR